MAPQPGHIGLDTSPLARMHIMAEIESLPFKTGTVERIHANQVFEHLNDVLKGFNECHRVLCIGGELYLTVPKWPHEDAVNDPTHKVFFTRVTFEHYIAPGIGLYGIYPWQILKLEEDERSLAVTMTPIKPDDIVKYWLRNN